MVTMIQEKGIGYMRVMTQKTPNLESLWFVMQNKEFLFGMAWVFGGLPNIVYIQGIMDGPLYCDVLREGLLPYIQKHNLNLEEPFLLKDHDSKYTCDVAARWRIEEG